MLRQLDQRGGDGIVVELLWDDAAPPGSGVLVRYRDLGRRVSYALRVPGVLALDAFHHPNAYAEADTQAREP